jgi:uncharacterized membrane protein YoaK (UPF0700 family)
MRFPAFFCSNSYISVTKIFAAFLERHVKNLNLYRKNNIISPYKKRFSLYKCIIAAVAIGLYFKIIGTVLLVVLTFLGIKLKKHTSRKSLQRKYTHTACVTKVYTMCSTIKLHALLDSEDSVIILFMNHLSFMNSLPLLISNNFPCSMSKIF